MTLLTPLDMYYAEGSLDIKRKLIFEGGNYRTTQINPAIELIGQFQRDLGKEKAGAFFPTEKMSGNVHRRGLEPLTTWFEARYSIRLSYRCKEARVTRSGVDYKENVSHTFSTMERCLGIVLSILSFKESDRIATVFTPGGLVKFIIKQKNAPLIAVLTEGEFHFVAGRSDLLGFREGSILNQHLQLRERLESIEAAGKMAQAIMKSQWPGKAAPHLYQLFCYCLRMLPACERPDDLLSLFLIKTLKHEGLLQMEECCSLCEKKPAFRFGGERFCNIHAPKEALKLSHDEEELIRKLAEGRSLKEALSQPTSLRVDTLFNQAFST